MLQKSLEHELRYEKYQTSLQIETFKKGCKKDKLGYTIQQMGPLNHWAKQKMSASS